MIQLLNTNITVCTYVRPYVLKRGNVRIEYGNAKSKCNIQTTKIKFILEMNHQRLQERTTVGQSA